MSDMERDQIDQDMVESMKACQSKIESLKAESKCSNEINLNCSPLINIIYLFFFSSIYCF